VVPPVPFSRRETSPRVRPFSILKSWERFCSPQSSASFDQAPPLPRSSRNCALLPKPHSTHRVTPERHQPFLRLKRVSPAGPLDQFAPHASLSETTAYIFSSLYPATAQFSEAVFFSSLTGQTGYTVLTMDAGRLRVNKSPCLMFPPLPDQRAASLRVSPLLGFPKCSSCPFPECCVDSPFASEVRSYPKIPPPLQYALPMYPGLCLPGQLVPLFPLAGVALYHLLFHAVLFLVFFGRWKGRYFS